MQRTDANKSWLNGSRFCPAVSCIDMHRRCSSYLKLRIIVNTPIPSKVLNYRFVLIAIATLLHANHVLAAEYVDAQMQARDLLSGTVGGRAQTVDASPAISADGHQPSNLDPQEQARQLILGKRSFGAAAGPRIALDSKTKVAQAAPARCKRRECSDAQELARRMILGTGA